MVIGVPSEIKPDEHRVALTPAGVRELRALDHSVLVEAGAGGGSGLADDEFRAQGAEIVDDAGAVFDRAEMVLKVKEPQESEARRLRPEHILFTYLHLAADPSLARRLRFSGSVCIAYETIEDAFGRLPLLAPMSEVAGKIAAQAGAFVLGRPLGGRGVLLGGVPGVSKGTVLIIGGGVVGANAARVAIGLGARVTVLDRSLDRLRELNRILGSRANLGYASSLVIEQLLPQADLVIGSVLLHGARAPRVVRKDHLARLKNRTVLVDVAIDQGGCFETSRPTTHSDPTYEVGGVTHYCVSNMPGAVPLTSTFALTNATLPYVIRLAEWGWRRALSSEPGFLHGLNIADGEITSEPVADSLGETAIPVSDVGVKLS